jgi:hypothetical protein
MAENQMAVLSSATISFGGRNLPQKKPQQIFVGAFLFFHYKIIYTADLAPHSPSDQSLREC